MDLLAKIFRTFPGWAPVILRLALATTMFPHGAQKVFGWFGGNGWAGTLQFFTDTLGIPYPLAVLAILTEFFAPICLLLGLAVRPAAFALAILISTAAVMVHLQYGFFMNWTGEQAGEGFEYHILVAGGCLALVFLGAGRLALDPLVHRRILEARRASS